MSAILHSIVVSIENDRISNLLNEWRDKKDIIKDSFDLWFYNVYREGYIERCIDCCDDDKCILFDKCALCIDCFNERKWKCSFCNVVDINMFKYYDKYTYYKEIILCDDCDTIYNE